MNILGKRSDLPFSRKSDRKKEKSTVSITHEQNIICSQTLLDSIAHEQTIICRHLFAGHLVCSRPMKRKKNLLRMIIAFIIRSNFGSIICLGLRLRQIIDLLATDKSRYFAQPRPIIVKYLVIKIILDSLKLS